MRFGLTQVSTQLSEHLEKTKASESASGRVTRSTSQVIRDLNYTIPKINQASEVQSTSTEEDSAKEDNNEKPTMEIDDEGFKIPQRLSILPKRNWTLKVIRK